MNLIINSKPGMHYALLDQALLDQALLGPYPNEITLVQALLKQGVDLKTMTCLSSRGTGFECISLWSKP